MVSQTGLSAWRSLETHRAEIEPLHLRDLFEEDPDRAFRFCLEGCGILFDFSKQRLIDRTLELLLQLARECRLEERIEALFRGEVVNPTEKRPALHMALRDLSDRPLLLGGRDIMPEVREVREWFLDFAEQVREGIWRGFWGDPIRDVVNLGIGGSDLGPRMATRALAPYHTGPRVHYVANLDPADLHRTLQRLDPRTTLFIVVSKTFTTQETMFNASVAKEWLLEAAEGDREAIRHHFVAVSTSRDRVEAFGIDPRNMFGFWEWVGGRYSIWSAVGLSTAIAIGKSRFLELLDGASEVDRHFRSAPLEENLPVVMGLLTVWYSSFWRAESYAVIPYAEDLQLFVDHLQQLEMESCGKGVTVEGEPVGIPTGPIVWGGVGTNAQHSFFQLLHQGTHLVPVDFIAFLQSHYDQTQHEALLANCFAQAEALMRGKTEEEVAEELKGLDLSPEERRRLIAAKRFPGNRPSSILLLEKLTPKNLGRLVALYEHKVYVQSVLWNINPFDQMGVELGKQLAREILPQLRGGRFDHHDASTARLIERYRRWRTATGSLSEPHVRGEGR